MHIAKLLKVTLNRLPPCRDCIHRWRSRLPCVFIDVSRGIINVFTGSLGASISSIVTLRSTFSDLLKVV
eukprot:scaffold4049_cov204-Alexandrium_tamarense.AAC.42